MAYALRTTKEGIDQIQKAEDKMVQNGTLDPSKRTTIFTVPDTTKPQKKPDDGPPGPGDDNRGGGTTKATAAPKYDAEVPNVFGDTTDPELLSRYQNAMQALEQMKGQAPTYGSQYDAQIQSLYQQIIDRGPFKYDSKTDPLYQQYVQDYTQQGKMAMRDTMGQAAALTGGYGSSYGQAVGQQMYDQYLQRMADILPQTYGMALDAYNAEGDRLTKNLGITTDLEKSDYGRYLDKLNQHNIDVDRATADVDAWYKRMTDKEQQNYSRQLDQYDLQNDYYNRLRGLMSVGYKPSIDDYHKAGLSQAQGEAIRAQYVAAANRKNTSNPAAYKAYQAQLAAQQNGGGVTLNDMIAAIKELM